MFKSEAKYFDGLRPVAQVVFIEVIDRQLQIQFKESQTITWPMMALKRDQSVTMGLGLICQGQQGSLEITDLKMIEELERFVGQSIAPKKNILKWALGTLALVIFFGLVIYSSLEPLSKYLAKKVPFSIEQDYLAKSSSNVFSACELNPSAKEALDQIHNKMFPLPGDPLDLKIDIQVMPVELVNAFAMPGGKIYLSQGFLAQADSPTEVVGVLAHEIAHVTERHILQTLIQASVFAAGMSFLSGDYGSLLVVDPTLLMGLIQRSYSRNMEIEADQQGLLRLKNLGVSPKGLKSFFEKQTQRTDVKLFEQHIPQWLSTHPSTPERIHAIDLALSESQNEVTWIDDQQWQSLKNPCLK